MFDRNFEPGGLGFHEIVDRTFLVAEMFSTYVSQHPGADVNPKIRRLCDQIEGELFDLYQALATVHDNDETTRI